MFICQARAYHFLSGCTAKLAGCDSAILDPRNTYADKALWQSKAEKLADLFIDNFVQFTDNAEGQSLVAAGPQK